MKDVFAKTEKHYWQKLKACVHWGGQKWLNCLGVVVTFCCCDKIPSRSKLMKKRFVEKDSSRNGSAHGSRDLWSGLLYPGDGELRKNLEAGVTFKTCPLPPPCWPTFASWVQSPKVYSLSDSTPPAWEWVFHNQIHGQHFTLKLWHSVLGPYRCVAVS